MNTSNAISQVRLFDRDSNEISEQVWNRFSSNSGIPASISTRVQELLVITRKIGGHVINIGRILIAKIIEFVRSNPNMVIGVAIGAAVGALINVIPFFGPLLAPLAMAIGAFIGGAFGTYLDKKARGGVATTDSLGAIIEGTIEAAKVFLSFAIEVFSALRVYLTK
jgi:hypothetical protein